MSTNSVQLDFNDRNLPYLAMGTARPDVSSEAETNTRLDIARAEVADVATDRIVSKDADANHEAEAIDIKTGGGQADSESAMGSLPEIPRVPFILLSLLLFNEAFAINVLWPFLPFMVEDLEPTDDHDQLGYFVGMLGGVFFFGQFLSSYLWGKFSDRYDMPRAALEGTARIALCAGMDEGRVYCWALSAQRHACFASGTIHDAWFGCLLFATLALSLCSFSSTYAQAIVSRFLWGMCVPRLNLQ